MKDFNGVKILLTGASGYIGGRLLKELENRGACVHCLARNPDFLKSRTAPETVVFKGDVLDKESCLQAMQDIDVAYYLVHSMGAASGFEEKDAVGAQNFAQAAAAMGVKKIIYLGGLGDENKELSAHLASRQQVGLILRESFSCTIELRASIVIGSGSLSFEMIRSLTEKIPIMITPKWVKVMAQPIGIRDLLDYLLQAALLPAEKSIVYEIGGADQLSYSDLMHEYARQRGLKRIMIPVPVLSPCLSSLWLGLVTPLYARIGKKLIDSLKFPTVVTNDQALQDFDIQPVSAARAIADALKNEDKTFAETRWFDSLSSSGAHAGYGGYRLGRILIDQRERQVRTTPGHAFRPVYQIGGKNGWYALNFLWKLRGFLDLLVGGVGMRRGRPQQLLRPGDTIDFWRVEVITENTLRLFAEMKLPGKAWLEFTVVPDQNGSIIRQTATFYPKGLLGRLYWFSIYPLHVLVFKKMLENIARAAESEQDG